MKKRFASLILVLFIGILIFTGCGFTPLNDGPKLTDPVTTNGKIAVKKGNYLYFANGFTKTDDMVEGDNKYNSVSYSALYRAKLDSEGNLQYDADGNLVEVYVLAPKVVGFENGGFYIFDDKIYYASPNSEKDNVGSIDFTKTDFYSSNLDGTNVTRIYKTEVASTKFQFSFYKFGGTPYLVVYDSADLFVINCNSKSAEKVATSVSSVALPSVLEYTCTSTKNSDTMTDAEKCVYYTRTAVDEDNSSSGNIFAMVNMETKEEILIGKNATFTAFGFKIDNIVYTKKMTNEDNAYYYNTPIENGSFNDNKTTKLTYQSFDNTPILLNFENGNYRGMVIKNASGYLTLINVVNNGMPSFTVLTEEVSLTPIAVYNNDIYGYDSNNQLYKINYKTKALVKLTDSEKDTLDFSMNVNTDFDNKYVYFYKKYVGDDEANVGYYLVRLDTTQTEEFTTELVGVRLEKHIKTEDDKK